MLIVSEVTNVLLAFSILEDAASRIADVNTWLNEVEQLPLAGVWECDAAVGGGKRMEAPLYAGAFNYFDLSKFLVCLRSIGWGQPDEVQVMVRAHGDDRWRVIDA
jgi:hypothetical protein